MLITFEGIDGSGKSTQAELLSKRLTEMGLENILTREPGGTKVAEDIRNIVKHSNIEPKTEMLLLYASRLEHYKKVIHPNNKIIVISDRFDDSTVAYQHYGRRINLKHIEAIRKIAIGTFEPVFTVFIDIDIEVRNSRMRARKQDKIEKSNRSFHKRVIKGYRKMSEEIPRFFRVDGTKPKLEVHNSIVEELKKRGIIKER